MHRWRSALLVAVLTAAALSTTGQALAHGKELEVTVRSVTVEVGRPEVRLYIVSVAYAADQEPVTGATVRLTAARATGGPTMGPLTLMPLNEPGLYSGQVTFPRFGTWQVTLKVTDALGEGEATIAEEVLPAAPVRGASIGEAPAAPQRFGLLLGFGWRDVLNIAVRVLHSLAAVAWYAVTAAVLGAYLVAPQSTRSALLGRLAALFPWVAIASLSLVALSGLYNAVYNAPIKPPGALDVAVMRNLPYGPAYLATLGVKLGVLLSSAALALAMARTLRRVAILRIPVGGAVDVVPQGSLGSAVQRQEHSRLFRLALATMALGIVAALSVPVSIYLHNLSHLGLVVPR